MKRFPVFVLLASLFLGGCLEDKTPTQGSYSDRSLQYFAAPWCTECKEKISNLEGLLQSKHNDLSSHLERSVVMVTGELPSHRPTREITEKTKSEWRLEMAASEDMWKWKNYRTHFGAPALKLPALVVFDNKGIILKRFSQEEFSPEAIAKYLSETGQEAPATP